MNWNTISAKINPALYPKISVQFLLPACLFLCSMTYAQTAEFSGEQSTIGNALGSPNSVAVDGSGNVYIATDANVYKETLNADGSYTQSKMLAGLNNPEGVAVDDNGNVYIADSGSNEVLKETLSNGKYKQSIIASNLNHPCGVAVDRDGNVYIADSGNNSVLKETFSSGNYIQSVIVARLNNPEAVAVDSSHNVYIADSGSDQVLRETLNTDGSFTQTTIGTGLNFPASVAVDGNGNVYIADSGNNRVLKETPTKEGYNQSVLFVGLYNPEGIAMDSHGSLYIADHNNNRVLKECMSGVDFYSEPVEQASPDQTLTFTIDTTSTLGTPIALTMGTPNLDFAIDDKNPGSCSNGAVFEPGATCTVNVKFTPRYAGSRDGAVELTNSKDAVIATAYVYGTGIGPQVAFAAPTVSTIDTGLRIPTGIAVDGNGNVYIADTNKGRVLKESRSADGSYVSSIIGTGLYLPYSVAVDGSGNVYIADTNNSRILKETLNTDGSYTQSTIGSGLDGPYGVAVDNSGNLYITDSNHNRVLRETLNADGSYTQSTIDDHLDNPWGVAVDNIGNVYIVDNNNCVLKEILDADGSYTRSTIVNNLNYPTGVAVDGNGNVYIANTGDNSLLKETLNGTSYTQSTISTNLQLNDPFGIAVDESGNIYITDTYNDRVLEEDFADIPSLSFPQMAVGSQSSPRTVTIENLGNATLKFPILPSGSNPSISKNFSYDNSSTCMQSDANSAAAFILAPGASCNLNIDFAPQSAGAISGSAVLVDNSLNTASGKQSILLNGTAILITLTPMAGALTDGTVNVNYRESFTANGGSTSYTFSSSDLPAWLSLSSSGILSGTPTTAGNYSFIITATGGNGLSESQSYTLKVDPAVATISILNLPSNAIYGSNSTATLSYPEAGDSMKILSSSTPSVCSVSGMTVSYIGVGTCSVTATATATNNYKAASSTQNIAVHAASLTVAASNGSMIYGAKPPTINPTYWGFVNKDTVASLSMEATCSSTVTSQSPVGNNYRSSCSDAADNNYIISYIPGTVTISQAATSTTLSTSASSINPGQSLTLTATVVDSSLGSSGTPTGSVSFYEGTTLLGTSTLNNGTGSYTLLSPAPGTDYAFTAIYAGSVNFKSSRNTQSPTINVAPENFTFTPTGATNQTVGPVSSVSYTLQANPTYGAYPGVVMFSVKGLPAGATATFSPATLAANAGEQTVTMSIQMAGTTTARNNNPFEHGTAILLGSFLLPLLGLRRVRKTWKKRGFLVALFLLGALASITTLTGCGVNGGHPSGTYSISVIAISGTVTHTAKVTLNEL